MLELVDNFDLESKVKSVWVRVPSSGPTWQGGVLRIEQWLATPLTNKVARWLRSIVAMHFLGKEETGGSSPLGASKRPQRNKVGSLICGGLKSYA